MIGELGTRLPLTRGELTAITARLVAAQFLSRVAQSRTGGAVSSDALTDAAPNHLRQTESECGLLVVDPQVHQPVLHPAASVGGGITGTNSSLRAVA